VDLYTHSLWVDSTVSPFFSFILSLPLTEFYPVFVFPSHLVSVLLLSCPPILSFHVSYFTYIGDFLSVPDGLDFIREKIQQQRKSAPSGEFPYRSSFPLTARFGCPGQADSPRAEPCNHSCRLPVSRQHRRPGKHKASRKRTATSFAQRQRALTPEPASRATAPTTAPAQRGEAGVGPEYGTGARILGTVGARGQRKQAERRRGRQQGALPARHRTQNRRRASHALL
jgi:hypothetical protein